MSFPEIAGMTESLTYNTYLGKYVLVSPAGAPQPRQARRRVGLLLLDLRRPDRLDAAAADPRGGPDQPATECGDPNPVGYPSLLDPDSPSRNFETTGRRPWLYFTRFHYKDCRNVLNRDLVRVRVRFSK